MSRIGKKLIQVEKGVTVTLEGNKVLVSGPRGIQTLTLKNGVSVSLSTGTVTISAEGKDKETKAFHGLTRAQVANMIKGVSLGFEKTLELVGVGYRAQIVGDELTLSLGFSHPVKVKAPEGITFSVAEGKGGNVTVTVSGIDRQLVGQIAAKIRNIKPPEPYKGKGIRYLSERVRKKAGKAAKAIGVAAG